MSHIVGTVQILATPQTIGPGTTFFNPPPSPQPGGTKLLVLHFQNLNFRPGDELQVSLGYDVDTFSAADAPEFWTRPVNVYAFPSGVQITYVPGGADHTGNVQLDQYGRGERHAGEPGHPSFSNCDPFYQPPSYQEPTYDPYWYCTDPPDWENAACATPATDIRASVSRSVGMILSVETSEFTGLLELSTCSVTLIDTDKVITAGHCHSPAEALNSSITFDYFTNCDGSRPAGYNPKFIKVKAVLAHHYDSVGDFSLLQLEEAPVGVPVLQMRPNFPAVGEQVFGIHHPNGAVKKLSVPHTEGFGFVTASSATAVNVSYNSVSGGSSGSGLFDLAGRLTGVLSNGAPCSGSPLNYFPSASILQAIAPAPPPPVTRDVMLVFDRSGSMSLDDGTGRAKIDVARDALSLFVQLVKANVGNRIGLVSFSTTASSPVDFALADVVPANKITLIGPPPYTSGKLLGLTPGGATTIGGGLHAAIVQLAGPGTNPKAILLMTDGLENTPPMVADVEPALAGLTLHAIGFGRESSLNGALLNALATTHGGLYTRAGVGLSLEKFYSAAFGNIFETGILMDPEFDLPADVPSGTPVLFRVCGEGAITAVAGWDNTDGQLLLEVTTPGGAVITGSTPTAETATGRTWTFLRIPLPIGGERDGAWSVNVVRPGGGGEFPPPTPALRYFINVIPTGGPRMSRFRDTTRYYTGDTINPMVLVRNDDGGWPDGMQAKMIITYPDASIGNVLSKNGLGAAGTTDADTVPARQATLQAIEESTGKPVVNYLDTTITLGNDSDSTDGAFEPTATFGQPLVDFLTVEGNYTFHAIATYGSDCTGMREMTWSLHVDIGIDPEKTTVTSSELPPEPGGGTCYRLTFTPRDKYGNRLGPGRSDGFTLQAQQGSTPSGPVTDLGDGSYQVEVCTDLGSLDPPQIGIVQPGRPPVAVGPANFQLFLYSVKFICGEQKEDCCGCAPVRPGHYSTEINIHNYQGKQAPVLKRAIPLVLAGAAIGREPNFKSPSTTELIQLPAHGATMDDCCRLQELLFGAAPAGSVPLTIGILEIVSTVDLAVTAVYTASDSNDGPPSINVQQIGAKLVSL